MYRLLRVVALGFVTLTYAVPVAAQQQTKTVSASESTDQGEQKTQRDERFVLHNTWLGPVGGFHVVDAGSAPKGTFRLQLGVDFFSASDFLISGDEHDHVGGALSFSWTPLSFLELYGAVLGNSNTNSQSVPQLSQVMGDINLGIKAFHAILPWLIIGGDVGTTFLNSVDDIGIDLAATGFSFRANLSTDFRRLRNAIPLLARLGIQYQLDNSSELVQDVEQQRFNALDDAPTDPQFETRHLITNVERYNLNINRVDRLNISVGAEAPLAVTSDFTISPIVEWQLGIPINRQGYNCPFVPGAGSNTAPMSGTDGCLDQAGFEAFPMMLTMGAKFLPPVRGLAVFAGVDIGLQGTSNFVRELAPLVPYSVFLGAGYAYDTREPEPVVIERERAAVAGSPGVRIQGVVVDAATNAPITRAEVHFTGTSANPLLTNSDGHFASYALPNKGPVMLDIRADGFESATCLVQIPQEQQEVQTRCPLKAAAPTDNATVQVVDDKDAPVVGAMVIFIPVGSRDKASSSAQANLQTDNQGLVSRVLQPGEYTLRIDASDFLMRQQTIRVEAQQKVQVKVTLTAKPQTPLVRVQNDKIVLRKQIHFAPGKAEVSLDSIPIMEEIADVLIRNPEMLRIEIQGHTDNIGKAALNKSLSERRAEAIRTWLIEEAGIDKDRLTAKGFGMEQPLVPNITPSNRARNRRVQFVILERVRAADASSDSKSVAP